MKVLSIGSILNNINHNHCHNNDKLSTKPNFGFRYAKWQGALVNEAFPAQSAKRLNWEKKLFSALDGKYPKIASDIVMFGQLVEAMSVAVSKKVSTALTSLFS